MGLRKGGRQAGRQKGWKEGGHGIQIGEMKRSGPVLRIILLLLL
jgi:hypothetical protein